jgi:hypothetical protein
VTETRDPLCTRFLLYQSYIVQSFSTGCYGLVVPVNISTRKSHNPPWPACRALRAGILVALDKQCPGVWLVNIRESQMGAYVEMCPHCCRRQNKGSMWRNFVLELSPTLKAESNFKSQPAHATGWGLTQQYWIEVKTKTWADSVTKLALVAERYQVSASRICRPAEIPAA